MVIDQDEDVESLSIEKDKQKSDVFGLWVKLKIPKEEREEKQEEEGMDIGDQMNKYSNNMKRVCHICHKAFSSGKALGGHMRIHVQLSNKKDDDVFKKKLKVIDFVKKKHTSGNMIEKPTCMICGKDFPSMKSLFGHMRCHPERDWRGIHPPSSMAKNSPSSSSLSDAEPPKIDDQMGVLTCGEKGRTVDLTQSLMRWPVTAKRGRKAMAAGSSSDLSSSEDDQLRDAVNYLMMLAQGDSLGVTQRQNLGESEAKNSFCKAEIVEINLVSKWKKRKIDQSSVEQHGNEQRGSNEVGKAVIARSDLVHGESTNKFSDDDQMDSKKMGKFNETDLESTNSKVMIKNKKKRKKMKLCDLQLSKNASTTPIDKYRCNTCDKSFPTHQALGGHRSSHNKFNIINSSSTSEALEDHKKSNNIMCQKVLEIDLNEAPPSEDEAGFESELACSW